MQSQEEFEKLAGKWVGERAEIAFSQKLERFKKSDKTALKTLFCSLVALQKVNDIPISRLCIQDFQDKVILVDSVRQNLTMISQYVDYSIFVEGKYQRESYSITEMLKDPYYTATTILLDFVDNHLEIQGPDNSDSVCKETQ